MSKKEQPVDGTVEEWIPKTAHEVAVGMFHGLPNILVPARHHLTKIPGNEAKTVLKAVNRALTMVTECTAKFAKVPGPIRANFRDGETFVIVENDTNRVTARDPESTLRLVNLFHRRNTEQSWVEVVEWDLHGENACSQVIVAIARIVAGAEITLDDVSPSK